jgi:hypothetical protein
MKTFRADLQPTVVDEWIAEDQFGDVLSGDPPTQAADDARAKEMLNQTIINLPQALDWCELVSYAREHKTAGGLQIPPDSLNHSFYSVEVPITLILPGKQQLVRLRLELELSASKHQPQEVVAYDLFPGGKQVDVKKILAGAVDIDISKGLQYILKVANPALAPAAECLGLKINAPFQWDSRQTILQCSERMSNPVRWYVLDKAIQNGFAPNVIIRAPKDSTVTVTAKLAGEVRERMMGVPYKTHFHPPKPYAYTLQ